MHSINLPSGFANENYYESETAGTDTSSAGIRLVFDRSGDLYVLRENNTKYNVSEEESKVSTTLYYLRATLNFDGVFAVYKHPKNSIDGEGWTTVWSKPDNICTYTCPKSYSLVDADDPLGTCEPNFMQGCAEDELSKNRNDLYEFETLIDVDWSMSDSVLQKPFTEDQCMKVCMEDCYCSVAIFRLGDSCWKKKLPLSNGKYDPTLNGAKAFFKQHCSPSTIRACNVHPRGTVHVHYSSERRRKKKTQFRSLQFESDQKVKIKKDE
ncbi:putative non-specific serine/threonine protein kinase [Medicago truncatula]|uniref:Putative non-specific serine/threonine protein kinase n=1 Tax=Medicago truncatula TaxID=3880 RepID=A0A396GEI0_MEDTR|nr:putative non-specific serine/threonine protein kinase [Medicago truncatula]